MAPKQRRGQKEEEAQEAGKNEITVLKIHMSCCDNIINNAKLMQYGQALQKDF